MSGSIARRSKVVGGTAVGALLLAAVPATGAQAASANDGLRNALAARNVFGSAVISPRVAEAGAAQRATDCVVDGVSPTKITLGSAPVKKTFKVDVSGCTVGGWAVIIGQFLTDDESNPAGFVTSDSPTVSLDPHDLTNSLAGLIKESGVAGAWSTDETIDDVGDEDTTSLDFQLQRASTFGKTFNATPEPVKTGKKITLKGTLKRINWNGAKKLGYVGYAKAKVKVQFQADGTTGYKTVKTVTAGTGGKVSTTVQATTSGTWRMVFSGVSTTAAATSGVDAVKVTD